MTNMEDVTAIEIISNGPPCSQKKSTAGTPLIECGIPSVFRFTWPGQEERKVCFICGYRIRNLATAMGFELQLIALEKEG